MQAHIGAKFCFEALAGSEFSDAENVDCVAPTAFKGFATLARLEQEGKLFDCVKSEANKHCAVVQHYPDVFDILSSALKEWSVHS